MGWTWNMGFLKEIYEVKSDRKEEGRHGLVRSLETVNGLRQLMYALFRKSYTMENR